MDDFEQHRSHLRAVAYRMLGSLNEADDAVQEAWLRYNRTDTSGIANLGGWLTTVVSRICLDQLRVRTARREEPLGVHMPDPIITDPEHEAVMTDSVGLALLVVLDTLQPAERLAFVLHDLFSVPFDEIAGIVGRTPNATKMMASRARTRVRDAAPAPDRSLARQREAVDAFLAAARAGDFERLLTVLDPDVVLRADGGAAGRSVLLRGAQAVADSAVMFAGLADLAQPVLVNGVAGVLAIASGKPMSVMAFTVVDGRIVAIDGLNDPQRLLPLADLARQWSTTDERTAE